MHVTILGVLDRSTSNFRLRASEPFPKASQTEQFKQILAPLPNWVVKSSKILTDYSVDKESLKSLGYTDIEQCNTSLPNGRTTTNKSIIMEYLKEIVPNMFQVRVTPEYNGFDLHCCYDSHSRFGYD